MLSASILLQFRVGAHNAFGLFVANVQYRKTALKNEKKINIFFKVGSVFLTRNGVNFAVTILPSLI